MEALQKVAGCRNRAVVLTDDVGLQELFKFDLCEDEGRQLVVNAHDVLEEVHYADAQTPVVGWIRSNQSNLFVDHREEFWREQARSVVAAGNLLLTEEAFALSSGVRTHLGVETLNRGACQFPLILSGL